MTTPDCKLVDTEVWEPDPRRPGFLQLIRVKTVGEVYAELRAIVGESPTGGEEYFSCRVNTNTRMRWPHGEDRCAVYVTTGGSEGHYIHVDALRGSGKWQNLLLAKTFAGHAAAWEFARRLATLIQL